MLDYKHKNKLLQMTTRILVVVFVLSMIISGFSNELNAFANVSSVKNKENFEKGKLIASMVYDDSDSMTLFGNGERAAYCNYSFQLFLSLFNKNDDLYMTFMSNPKKSIDYSIKNKNRQELMDRLKNHQSGVRTPIAAVKTAYEKLINTEGENNDKYWLIILSDGEFYNDQGKKMKGDYLNQYFDTFTSTKMPNGSDINILFVGIGDDVVLPTQDLSRNITIEKADSEEALIDIVKKNAELISGCGEAKNLTFLNTTQEAPDEITITSNLELSKLIILSQNTKESIISIKNQDGVESEINETVFAEYEFMNYAANERKKISGNTSYVEPPDSIISPNTYTVTYTGDINLSDLAIYALPSFDMDIKFFDHESGKEISNFKDVIPGTYVDAAFEIFKYGTNVPIDPRELSKDANYVFNVTSKDKIIRTADLNTKNIRKILVPEEGLCVNAAISFGPMNAVGCRAYIDVYKLEFTEKDVFGFDINTLYRNNETLKADLFCNGQKVGREDMAKFQFEFGFEGGNKIINSEAKILSDGTVSLKPSFGSGNKIVRIFTDWVATWAIRSGDANLSLSVYDLFKDPIISETTSVKFVNKNNLLTLWYYLKPIFIILAIVGFIFKYRFNSKVKISRIKMRLLDNDQLVSYEIWEKQYVLNRNYKWDKSLTSLFSFIPFIANRKNIGGITFIASNFLWKEQEGVDVNAKGNKFKIVDCSDISTKEGLEIGLYSSRISENDYSEAFLEFDKGILVLYDHVMYLYKISKGGNV